MGSFISGRVTTSMLTNNYLDGMNKNLSNLQTINNQLTTGKEISRPSDNPYKVARTMQLYSSIDANKQYNENIKDTLNWLDTTDTALGQVTTVFQRIRELMVSAGNAAYGTQERESINNEVKERVGELGQILNTTFDGRYIFGGTKVASKPINVDKEAADGQILKYSDKNGNPVKYDDLNKELKSQLGANLTTEVSQGVTIDYNVTAQALMQFQDGNESIDAMKLLSNIVSNLGADESTADGKKKVDEVTTNNLSDIDKVINNLLKIRSEVGAKQNRMESAQSQNEDSNYNMTDILSKTEDIDWTQKTIEYYMARTVYQASLQVSAQILPATLLDYL
ncbi:flagellar hook-associated protein FlgL [Clostridium sp. HCP1S3_B4]|uniref:flagellar hook-associated protein FlgL n=1 Tax=unclassified Clostridium TaxID=2614128 RepID=UPI003F8A96F8